MKKWCFTKKEHNFELIIEDNGKVIIVMKSKNIMTTSSKN